MQCKKANGNIVELGTEMYTENPLINWYFIVLFNADAAGVIQTTTGRLIHHTFIERQRDLVRLTVVHHPYRPNHGAEPDELHHRREVDRLVRTLFVSDRRMTRREIRKFGVLQFEADDPLDRKVSVVQSEPRLGRPCRVWDTGRGQAAKIQPDLVGETRLYAQESNYEDMVRYVRCERRCEVFEMT